MPKNLKKDGKLQEETRVQASSNATGEPTQPRPTTANDSASPPSTQDIMDAITALSASFNQKFDTLTEALTELRSTMTSITERVTTIEEATTNQETRLTCVEKQCAELLDECKRLKDKCNDLESRSRRNNIRLIGVAEKEENGRPTEFIAKLLPKLLGPENFSKPIQIDRAHRALRRPSDDRPRAFVIRIHHYQTKELIMKLAREKSLEYNGRRVHIFPDLTSDVLKQRYRFAELKKKCKNFGVKYGFRFPSTFIVTAKEGETKTFETPEEAGKYLSRVVDNWPVD